MNKVYVIGPINTGTNLVHKLFENSECINKTTGLSLFINDPKMNFKNGLAHKHATNVNIIKEYIKPNDTLIVIMYKNVYNWIYSLQKAHYQIEFTNLNNTVKLCENTYKNCVHLYNYYYSMYIYLIQNNQNVMFLDYNKVIDKNNCFNYINTKLDKYNLCLKSNEKLLETLDKPSKGHGKPVKNSNEAIQSYLSNQILVKRFLKNKTKIHKDVNNKITNYFE